MLRVLLSPRWVAVTLLMVAAVVVCAGLGRWQWDRATPETTVDVTREGASGLTAILDRVEAGGEGVPPGALVRASGRYDVDATEVVPGVDPADARTGDWVVTPLVLDDGRQVLVVRGWSPAGTGGTDPDPGTDPDTRTEAAVRPTSDDVVITGRLQPPAAGVDEQFVALTDQRPRDAQGVLDPVEFPVPQQTETDLRLINAMYALQWWIFAVFWVYLWWREVRSELGRDQLGREQRTEQVAPDTP